MSDVVTAAVTLTVAKKIYSNVLKGNPPFKPWKGMEGCAWFGYDGSPNAGDLASQGKTIKVEAMADIPANTPKITKKMLEDEHDRLKSVDRLNHAQAEGRMWHQFVGHKGRSEAGGMLIVLVGGSRFSNAAGKYLLVNNAGLSRLTMSDTQAKALCAAIDEADPLNSATLVARLDENTKTHGAKFDVHYPSGEPKTEDALQKFVQSHLSSGTPEKWVSIVRTPKVLPDKKEKRKGLSIFWTLEYESYHAAKREARRIYGKPYAKTEGTFRLAISWGDGEHWKYKESKSSPSSPPGYGQYRYA